MAHVYVGFHDTRSCNRILKPPGGGTSNIFGTDDVPDLVPKTSPRKENKHGSTIQHILQTESVTTSVTKREEKNSSSNGHNEELTVAIEGNSKPDVTAEVTSKVEELKIEEKSSKVEVTETDSSGNTKVVSSNSTSEGSVESNSRVNKGSSIGSILQQDDVLEKKNTAIKPQNQRVPPGGYSSGLW